MYSQIFQPPSIAKTPSKICFVYDGQRITYNLPSPMFTCLSWYLTHFDTSGHSVTLKTGHGNGVAGGLLKPPAEKEVVAAQISSWGWGYIDKCTSSFWVPKLWEEVTNLHGLNYGVKLEVILSLSTDRQLLPSTSISYLPLYRIHTLQPWHSSPFTYI